MGSSISVVCSEELAAQGDSANYHRVRGVLQEKGYNTAAENVQSVRVLAHSLHVTFVVGFSLGSEVRQVLLQEFGIGETIAPNGTSKDPHRQGGRKYKFPVRRDVRWR